MAKKIKIYEHYMIDGGGMGYHMGTIDWYRTRAAAERAAAKNCYSSVQEYWALEFKSGKVYILQQKAGYPITTRSDRLK